MYFKKKILTRFYLSLLFAVFYALINAQVDQTTGDDPSEDLGKSFLDKLIEENIREMRIYMDFDTVIGKKEEKEYADAIVVTLKNGQVIDSLDAQIRARGIMRNDFCKFPPQKINFSKKDLRKAGLNDMNEVKIVVPCKSSSIFTKYIVQEKLIYDLYNLVSPYSYRTQIVEINYYDLNSDKKKESKTAFILEHKEELAHRFKGKVVDREKGSEFIAQDEWAVRLAVFQYMIGNTDFAYVNMHNVEYIYVPDNPKLTPVPFDFDYCGAINTEYAIPNQNLKITDVRIRYYQGMCRDDQMLLKTIRYFKELEPEILQTIENFDPLDKSFRTSMKRYIETFFNGLNNAKRTLKAFKVRC